MLYRTKDQICVLGCPRELGHCISHLLEELAISFSTNGFSHLLEELVLLAVGFDQPLSVDLEGRG